MLYWYLVGLIVKELFLLPSRCGGREGREVGGKEVKKMLAGINLCWGLSFSWHAKEIPNQTPKKERSERTKI